VPGIEGNHEKQSLRVGLVPGIEGNHEKQSLRVGLVPGNQRNHEKRSLKGAHSARKQGKSQKPGTLRG